MCVWLEIGWLECEVSRRRQSEKEYSTKNLIQLSDHREEIALAQQERQLKETNLEE